MERRKLIDSDVRNAVLGMLGSVAVGTAIGLGLYLLLTGGL